jgi:hypothetical protein
MNIKTSVRTVGMEAHSSVANIAPPPIILSVLVSRKSHPGAGLVHITRVVLVARGAWGFLSAVSPVPMLTVKIVCQLQR